MGGMDLFGTAGIRGRVSEAVTAELALAVGRAVGTDALEAGVTEVVLGRDGRVTGPALAAAAEAGLLSAGATVRRVGPVPTPALAYASRGRRGMMLTASHNPPADNGIKLFADGVEFDGSAEARIERSVHDGTPGSEWHEWGDTEALDVLAAYRSAVVGYARGFGAPLDGLRLAVDCGNGTGGLGTPQVLATLGADVTALHANVDGHAPARPSKPTTKSLAEFSRFVADGDYDLGLAHDGDADRIVVVDPGGSVVHEDTVLAILAERYVERSDAGTPVVVTTPNASGRIDERVSAAGGRTRRVALGALHEGIAVARAAGDRVAFAAEPWKHVHPAFGGWIDGVASAAVLARLVAEAGDVDALTEPVTERPYRKDEVACEDSVKAAAMSGVAETLPDRFTDARVDTDHGVRVDRPDGSWVLVRPSGTEPVIRIYAEGEDVARLVETARDVVERAVSSA